MRWILLASVLLLAGCAAPAQTETDDAPAEQGPDSKSVELYDFREVVTGTSPADPLQAGGAGDLPVLEETFEVAVGTTSLAINAQISTGDGYGRIEILAPDGSLVHASKTGARVGAPGVVGVGPNVDPPAFGGEPQPGTYLVRYYITGALESYVTVTARVPA